MPIKIKRAYEVPDPADGRRILVDRFWPRGISKADLTLSAWLSQLAPSNQLRRYFGHDSAKWQEFRERYLNELQVSTVAAELICELRKSGHEVNISLIYAARDTQYNHARVIKEFLENSLRSHGADA